jgi:hypothetical protein
MAKKQQLSNEEQVPAEGDAPAGIPAEGGNEAQPQPAEEPASTEDGGNEAQPLPAEAGSSTGEESAPQEEQLAQAYEEPLPPGWGYAADGVTITNYEGKTQEVLDAEDAAQQAVHNAQRTVAERRAEMLTRASDEQIRRDEQIRAEQESRANDERNARRERLARK